MTVAVRLLEAALSRRFGVERLLMRVERHDPEKRAEDDRERADEKKNRGHAMTPEKIDWLTSAPGAGARQREDRRGARRFRRQDPSGAEGIGCSKARGADTLSEPTR
jgi:hypothetical protein